MPSRRYHDYFYDNNAHLTRFTERQIVGVPDPHGQYTDDTAIQDDSYSYDAVGNRLSLTDNLTSEQILYTYDDFNKLLTAGNRSFPYDADGNCTTQSLQGVGVTRTYTWGYHNELLQITYGGGGTNTFTYDGSGRRVTKVDSTGSYSFVYDGDRIISDGQAVYTRAGSARLISERRGNNSQWYHSDGLTSTRTLTSILTAREKSVKLTRASRGDRRTDTKFLGVLPCRSKFADLTFLPRPSPNWKHVTKRLPNDGSPNASCVSF